MVPGYRAVLVCEQDGWSGPRGRLRRRVGQGWLVLSAPRLGLVLVSQEEEVVERRVSRPGLGRMMATIRGWRT
jgi:hypothetical protein